MQSITLVSILVAVLLVEAVKGGVFDPENMCPDKPCSSEKKCVGLGFMHLCRIPAQKGGKCSHEVNEKGFYEGFPPCAEGLTCPKEPTPKCQ